MNYELFIAKRIIANKKDKSSISSPIIKIAILAIALGMIVMLISVATGLGLKYKIRDKISGLNGHIILQKFNQSDAENSTIPITLDSILLQTLKHIDGVEKVQKTAAKNAMIRTVTDFEMVLFKGVSNDYDFSFLKEYLQKGSLPKITKDKTTNQIIISQLLADKLNLKIGDKVTTWFLKSTNDTKAKARSFSISGIYNSGIKEFDSHYIIGDLKIIQRLNKWKPNQAGSIEILIHDFKDIHKITDLIYQNIDPLINAIPITEKFPDIFEWISMFDVNITLIIVIMIIIGGINMITALLVLILERTQMIGILKALGNTNRSIRKIFLYNAGYLILRGLFWGNLIGLGLIFIERKFHFIQLDPDNYYVNHIPFHLSIYHIFLLNLGTLVLCILMLILPTYLVSKISPVKAIKFD
ncbi:MAG TPA: ABC transporter permease [Flavobacteriia bacterium]|nr:ABC transporter permease [Flavobacteriia bacterium]